MTPVCLVANRKSVHAADKVIPWQRSSFLAEKGEGGRLGDIGRCAVMEQKSYTQLLCRRKTRIGCRGEKLKRHGGGIVWYAVEILSNVQQTGQAKERKEGGVGAELDGQLGLLTFGSNALVEGFDDLGCESCACDGTYGLGVIVGES